MLAVDTEKAERVEHNIQKQTQIKILKNQNLKVPLQNSKMVLDYSIVQTGIVKNMKNNLHCPK